MSSVWILTEADEQIASGHLMECIDLVYACQKEGWKATLFINEDCPAAFKKRIPFAFRTYQRMDGAIVMPEGLHAPNVLVFNFRAITNRVIDTFRGEDSKIICIDEFGHRPLACDIIINPMVDPYYWNYETDATIYGGAQYLALSEKLQTYRKYEKPIRDHIGRIVVTMGGVDLHGTTVKLARWLPDICRTLLHDNNIRIDLVLGGGFLHDEKLKDAIKRAKADEQFRIHRNIDYLYDLLFDADLAVCAGGNTLHELAVLGTPAIVIPTMPHEERNGKAFEAKGCCRSLPPAMQVTQKDVAHAVASCLSAKTRQIMHQNGTSKFDGRGRERVLHILKTTR